jgi:hypothetical protein
VAGTAEQLDGMVVHVRYEVVKLINFVRLSNHWPHATGLDGELAQFTSESLLEASLIHSRNLIEFLQYKPGNSEVAATDYVIGFELPAEYEVSGRDYGSLSTRLTHMGLERLSANTSGDFRWNEYFDATVPKVLRGFRYFMRQLNERYAALFMQPRADLPWIDVIDGIDFVAGPDDDA